MRQIIFLVHILIVNSLYGQKLEKVPYSKEYEFKEGIYLTIEHFKNNAALPKSAIVSLTPKTQLDFLTKVTEQKIIVYKDSSGKEQKIETSTIWGYYRNRSLYVNFNNNFNRVGVIGTWCLFSAMVTKTATQMDAINGVYGMSTSYDEIQQFILDIKTNKILEFNLVTTEMLLKEDQELYSEFMKLKKRVRDDSIFVYFRKYNEKHPLYLPVN